MSGPTAAVPTRGTAGRSEDADGHDPDALFGALADHDCRTILRAIGTDALTANECSEACDLPLSTTYRKLERLVEGGLLAERLRIRRDGKHANQYRRDFEAVHLAVDETGALDVEVEAGGDESRDE